MKCSTCEILEPFRCSGFSTHDAFVKALGKLEEMKGSKKIEPLNLYDFRCYECSARWELSPPDNAFRGGLVQVSLRAQRVNELRSKLKT